MITKEIEAFDLEQICESGQCFRMEQTGPGEFQVAAGSRGLRLSQRGKTVTFFCGEDEFEKMWRRYFDLDEDYASCLNQAESMDQYLAQAAAGAKGIRILRQDLWEMIVSFLISQQNNIPRIRRCIENLCRTYGKRKEAEGFSFYTFPGPEVLAGLEEDALKPCNLGYRSKYVVRTARQIYEGGFSLEKLRDMEYEGARQELMKLFGVGEKVADCICLFALHHLAAFPVDTHIRQALAQHYPQGFPREKCRGREGIFQQYIFYYELHKERER
ncbi:MAG TPA: 8-oxoguanine DNA glycosylase [Candidatus Choladousia intestinigallinarum]|nr:8-oxoguanine DNA glycosylase [Candidatus Choladousia intestinigallinarum]